MTCISNTSVKLIKIGNQHFFYAGVCVYVHACVWMGGWRASTVLLFSVSRPVYKGTSLGDCVFTWCLSHDHINTQKTPTHSSHQKMVEAKWKPTFFSRRLESFPLAGLCWGSGALNSVRPWWWGRGGAGQEGVCVCAWVEGWGPAGLIKGQEGWESCSLI